MTRIVIRFGGILRGRERREYLDGKKGKEGKGGKEREGRKEGIVWRRG
jgi:hypothetical protein